MCLSAHRAEMVSYCVIKSFLNHGAVHTVQFVVAKDSGICGYFESVFLSKTNRHNLENSVIFFGVALVGVENPLPLGF